MADTPLAPLVDGLSQLQATFQPFSDLAEGEAIEINAADVRILLGGIRAMQRLALLADRELGALRLMETGRQMNAAVASELDDALDDKIIRPDFGGRP